MSSEATKQESSEQCPTTSGLRLSMLRATAANSQTFGSKDSSRTSRKGFKRIEESCAAIKNNVEALRLKENFFTPSSESEEENEDDLSEAISCLDVESEHSIDLSSDWQIERVVALRHETQAQKKKGLSAGKCSKRLANEFVSSPVSMFRDRAGSSERESSHGKLKAFQRWVRSSTGVEGEFPRKARADSTASEKPQRQFFRESKFRFSESGRPSRDSRISLTTIQRNGRILWRQGSIRRFLWKQTAANEDEDRS